MKTPSFDVPQFDNPTLGQPCGCIGMTASSIDVQGVGDFGATLLIVALVAAVGGLSYAYVVKDGPEVGLRQAADEAERQLERVAQHRLELESSTELDGEYPLPEFRRKPYHSTGLYGDLLALFPDYRAANAKVPLPSELPPPYSAPGPGAMAASITGLVADVLAQHRAVNTAFQWIRNGADPKTVTEYGYNPRAIERYVYWTRDGLRNLDKIRRAAADEAARRGRILSQITPGLIASVNTVADPAERLKGFTLLITGLMAETVVIGEARGMYLTLEETIRDQEGQLKLLYNWNGSIEYGQRAVTNELAATLRTLADEIEKAATIANGLRDLLTAAGEGAQKAAGAVKDTGLGVMLLGAGALLFAMSKEK